MITLETQNSMVQVAARYARVLSWQVRGNSHRGATPSQLQDSEPGWVASPGRTPEKSGGKLDSSFGDQWEDKLYPQVLPQGRAGGIPVIVPWFGVGPLGLGGSKPDFPKHGPFTDPDWEVESETAQEVVMKRQISWDQHPYQGICHLGQGKAKIQLRYTVALKTISAGGSDWLGVETHAVERRLESVGAEENKAGLGAVPGSIGPVTGKPEGIKDQLQLTLEIRNLTDCPQACEAALHTYFQLPATGTFQVRGLEGKIFDNALKTGHLAQLETEPVVLNQPLDRIYYLHPVGIDDGVISGKLQNQDSAAAKVADFPDQGALTEHTFKIVSADSNPGLLHTIDLQGYSNAVLWYPQDGRSFVCLEAASCRASGIWLPARGTKTLQLTLS